MFEVYIDILGIVFLEVLLDLRHLAFVETVFHPIDNFCSVFSSIQEVHHVFFVLLS